LTSQNEVITGLAVAFAVLALAGCGGGGNDASPTQPTATTNRAPASPEPSADVRPPSCPPELANCQRASGRILLVERRDPDGDGDAHFVLLSSESITAPGITIVDVRRDLRPQPLPGSGDELAAAGPVYPGSAGQSQIEAVAIRVGRAGAAAQ
jgi:hypothetical protein